MKLYPVKITIRIGCLTAAAYFICTGARADTPTTAEIRKRIAALSRASMRSASGNFVIVGTNRLESFTLARWCDSAVTRITNITGITPRLEHRISVNTGAANTGTAFVSYQPPGALFAAKVYLNGYTAAYETRGRQAICCAILAYYKKNPSSEMLKMPDWLWIGIEENLLFDVRSQNLEKTLTMWRKAALKPLRYYLFPSTVLSRHHTTDKTAQRDAVCSSFVHFLTSRSNRKALFSALLEENRGKNRTSLEKLVCGNISNTGLEELWERWLLQQDNVIRSSTSLSSRTIDQLRSELLLYPGTCGIPLDSGIRRGEPLDNLIKHRKAEWLPGLISLKRGRIAITAAGRGREMASVAALFDRHLAGLTGRESDKQLLARLACAYTALRKLADKIEKADGMLYEITPEVDVQTD